MGWFTKLLSLFDEPPELFQQFTTNKVVMEAFQVALFTRSLLQVLPLFLRDSPVGDPLPMIGYPLWGSPFSNKVLFQGSPFRFQFPL